MGPAAIATLGAIAGGTIFLGLPIALLRAPRTGLRAFLNAAAVGVLVFLLWDVLSHAADPLEAALTAAVGHTGSWARFCGQFIIMIGGLVAGLMSLVYYERWMRHRPAPTAQRFGPGAMARAELTVSRPATLTASPARRLALLIAVGIGLHNFSEGLAIGQSAANGEVSLAVILLVGFGLHNATEGFGITAPLVGEAQPPSLAHLALLGLIGGGPTFIGTLIGQSYVSASLYLTFLALAAGSILYVVIQLLGVAQKIGRHQQLYWGLLTGLIAGMATDFAVVAAGA